MLRDAIIRTMSGSNREIEVKLRFGTADEARERLSVLAPVERTPRTFEDNVLYEDPRRSLKPTGRLLRLRRWGDRYVLTFKRKIAGEYRHKVREEIETDVADADALDRLLRGLEFEPVYRYQKYRTLYRAGELELCLDETPVGCFVELEGPGDAIDAAAGKLGFEPGDYIRHTYRELHEQDAEARGVPVGDMVFEDGD
jgi:adenylate cyclase class 2